MIPVIFLLKTGKPGAEQGWDWSWTKGGTWTL